MQRMRPVTFAIVLTIAACGNTPGDPGEPIEPSAAAGFRGYAAVQDQLYSAFVSSGTEFELFRYLGEDGEALSRLVGRPDGFGVTFDTRNAKPNGMNVLVWRMMLTRFASDLAATCPASELEPKAEPPVALNQRATSVMSALCSWPSVTDEALASAWDLVVGPLAPASSRDEWIAFAHGEDLQLRSADQALPSLWLAAFLHPSFLLEQ